MITKTKKYTLDATNQTPGRLATQIAMILMGKNSTNYKPNVDNNNKVIVTNADKLRLTGKKLDQKEYISYSGFPGGLKRRPLKKIIVEKPEKVVWLAVSRMLPKNKLRNPRLKRMSFK